MTVKSLYPSFATDRAVSHIALSVCGEMRVPGMDVRMMNVSSLRPGRRRFNKDAIPHWLFNVVIRFMSEEGLYRFVQNRYLRWLKAGDIAYLWPHVDIEVYHEVKRRGLPLVMERINCHRGTSKRVLDEAYARLGWPASHQITDADIEGEKAKLAVADYVYSPSPRVDESLIENGVPEHKVLSTSFGWSPGRISQGTNRALEPIDGLTVIFVGSIGVRKGVPQLLRAWARSGIKGRLLLAGKVEPEIAEHLADILNRPDVVRLGYVDDIGAVYRSSDVFVFPSLEEGGPLVTYEAMGCGLPVVVTPMGAGAVAADGAGGAVIVPPFDEEALIVALRRLEKDPELRRELGKQGKPRAEEFTWTRVGERRSAQLRRVFGERVGAPAVAAAGKPARMPVATAPAQRVSQ